MDTIQLTQYIVDATIGQNEWFTFYQGRRKADDAPVLIKTLVPHLTRDEFVVRRLQHVTKQISQLEHPNILSTYEAEQDGDLLFVVQDFIEARSLADVLEAEGPFTLKRTSTIAAQIASALDSAHQKSVTHGSLSAKNILIGQNDRVHLVEFGESQAIFGINLSKHPIDIVAPETTAPERVSGQGPSRPADLYALGILCYQMLNGRPPFTGPASTILHAQAHRQARPIHEVNPGIPIAVSEIIERMLAKGIELRYNTGIEFVRAFNAACRTQKSLRSYDRVVPLTDRENPPANVFKTVFYWSSAIVMVLLVALLSAWIGYEWGLKQTSGTIITPANVEVYTTAPALLPTKSSVESGATITMTSQTVVDQATAQPILQNVTIFSDSLSNSDSSSNSEDSEPSLLPPPTPTLPSTATPTPTAAVIVPPTPTPTPEAAGQSRFVFSNPTGHDLIVDLSGPTNSSVVVPPGQRHEFTLAPGSYLYMVHTPGGKALAPISANFELPQGQVVEKDYYSDYDWARQ